MKNNADAIVFHTTICAGASQMVSDVRRETTLQFSRRQFRRYAPEWRIAMQEMYAYSRVLTGDMEAQNRINVMRDMKIPENHIYLDYPTRENRRCQQYKKLIKQMREGDLLYLASFSSLGDGYKEIEEQWRVLTREKKVDVVLIDMPEIDTRKGKIGYGPMIAETVLSVLEYVAVNESNVRKTRQREGIIQARERGVVFGRREKQAPDFDKAYQKWKSGELTADEAAVMCGLKKGTFYYRARKMQKQ